MVKIFAPVQIFFSQVKKTYYEIVKCLENSKLSFKNLQTMLTYRIIILKRRPGKIK
jgi:hypothetical protein